MIEVKLIGDWEIKREHTVKAGSVVEVTKDIAAQLVKAKLVEPTKKQ